MIVDDALRAKHRNAVSPGFLFVVPPVGLEPTTKEL